MSQEEGVSMHRQLKQKLMGSGKPKGLYNTNASFCPPALEEVSCGSYLLALVSCNNEKFLEDVELLCSLSIKHDYKSPSSQCCQFSESER